MQNQSHERKLVLEMLAAGKIDVDDAQRLLDKLQELQDAQARDPAADASQSRGPKPRHLRILATTGDGDTDVNLRIPLGLVRAGLAIESFLPGWAQGGVFVGSGLSDLRKLDLEEVRDNLDELDLSFESDDGETIRIFTD